jgi:hypothetical protein
VTRDSVSEGQIVEAVTHELGAYFITSLQTWHYLIVVVVFYPSLWFVN